MTNEINSPIPETSPPTQLQRLPNPYVDVDETTTGCRVQTNVSRQDYLLIKLIRPGTGTIRSVISQLWFKLCTSLRENDILDNSKQNEFEHFVTTSRLVDNDTYESLKRDASLWQEYLASTGQLTTRPDGTIGGPVTKAAGGNDRKRAKRVRAVSANDAG